MPTWSIGTGKDYTTLAAALAAAVIAGDDSYTFECYDGSNLGKIDFTGTGLNSSYFYIQPAAGEGHNGSLTTGAYIETTNGDDAITVTDDISLYMTGLRIKCSNTGAIPGRCIYANRTESVNGYFTINVGQCILIQAPPAGYDAAEAVKIASSSYDSYTILFSNLLVNQGGGAYGSETAAILYEYIGVSGALNMYDYSFRNTISCNNKWKYGIEIHRDTAAATSVDTYLTAHSNLAIDSITADYATTTDTGTGAVSVDGQGNGDSDGTADAWGGSIGNGVTGLTTATFNNFAGDDFSLAEGSVCREAGYQTWYSDILNEAQQGGAEDIGCFEYPVVFPDDWSKRFKITIPSGAINGDLLDYPIVFDLSRAPAGFHTVMAAQGTGCIRVAKADGVTQVPREIAWYDAAADKGELHFNSGGTLLSGSDNHFWIYYDNTNAAEPTDTMSAIYVWYQTITFQAVYHLAEAANTTSQGYKDSGAFTRHATGVSISADVTGFFGGTSPDLDGTADKLTTGLASSNFLTTTTGSVFTVAKTDVNGAAVSNSYLSRWAWGDAGGYAGAGIANVVGTDRFWSYNWDGNEDRVSHTYATATWYTSSWKHTSSNLYSSLDAANNNTASTTTTSLGGLMEIGSGYTYGGSNPYWNGTVDEVRFTKQALSADWIDADYESWHNQTSFINTVGAEEATPQFPADWGKRVKITIPSSTINGDILDYIFVFDLSRMPAGFHTVMAAQGTGSIRVTKADGTTLVPYDLAFYDATSDTGEIHIQTDGTLLSASFNEFYIYYDQVDADYPADPSFVWTTGAVTFAAVWHLTEAFNTTAGGYKDARGRYNGTGVSLSADDVDVWGNSAPDFDGTTDYLNFNTGTGFQGLQGLGQPISIVTWFRTHTGSAGGRQVILGDWNAPGLQSSFSLEVGGYAQSNNINCNFQEAYLTTSIAPVADTFYHVACTYTGTSTTKIYTDGVLRNTGSRTHISRVGTTVVAAQAGLYPTGLHLNGSVGEVLIATSVLTADWIDADYVFWQDQVSAVTVGSEESLGGFTATSTLSLGGIDLAAAATFTGSSTFTASVALISGGAEIVASATFDEPVFTASAALISGGAEISASALFAGLLFQAEAAIVVGRAQTQSAASFSAPVFSGEVGLLLSGVDVEVSASSSLPVYEGIVSLSLGAVELSADASFAAPTFSATGELLLGGVLFNAVSSFVEDGLFIIFVVPANRTTIIGNGASLVIG